MSKGKLVGIPPRKFNVDFDSIDASSYYGNDRVLTSFWNTLSTMFPEGEQFFVESIRNYRDQISDDRLQNEISGFIGQEAFHTHAHVKFNDMLKDHGYPVDSVDKFLKKALTFLRKNHPMLALHVTAILEHYTATLGMQLLEDSRHNGAISRDAKKLWIHHAIEEFEHRCVSFDVLTKVGGPFSDEIRILLFVPVSVVFFAIVAYVYTTVLVKQKVKVSELKSIIGLIRLLSDNLPKIRDWFYRDFHPSWHAIDTTRWKSYLNIAE